MRLDMDARRRNRQRLLRCLRRHQRLPGLVLVGQEEHDVGRRDTQHGQLLLVQERQVQRLAGASPVEDGKVPTEPHALQMLFQAARALRPLRGGLLLVLLVLLLLWRRLLWQRLLRRRMLPRLRRRLRRRRWLLLRSLLASP